MGVASFVLSLLGILSCWNPLGLLLSLLGLIFGACARPRNGLAVAGIVIGIIALIPAALITISCAGLLAGASIQH
jgi:hypothetical protein